MEGFQFAALEGALQEFPAFFGLQVILCNQRVQVSFLALADMALPFFRNAGGRIDIFNKAFDQLLLAAQLYASEW